jgi:acetylornithine deacetylase/succinyl-diaminopimelate desuccinylase
METGVAHKGVIRCEALFEGRAAHGSVPEKGVNAIYAASRWLEYITKIYIPRLNGRRHPLLGPPTFNAGVINGGTRIAIVPATCSVQFERRMLPGETREGVLAELRETLSAAFSDCPEFSGRIEELPVFRGVPHGPMETRLHEKLDQPMETVSASRLIAALAAAYEKEFGRKTEPKGFPYWTDAAILASIPRLHAVICGPGDIALAHSDEERLPRRELRAAFMIYLRAAMELCAAKR